MKHNPDDKKKRKLFNPSYYGPSVSEEEDEYLLTKALEREPESFLPDQFPDSVIARVEQKEYVLDHLRQMGLVGLIVLFFIFIVGAGSLLFQVSLLEKLMELVTTYKIYLFLFLFLGFLVQTADTLFISHYKTHLGR